MNFFNRFNFSRSHRINIHEKNGTRETSPNNQGSTIIVFQEIWRNSGYLIIFLCFVLVGGRFGSVSCIGLSDVEKPLPIYNTRGKFCKRTLFVQVRIKLQIDNRLKRMGKFLNITQTAHM